MIEAEHHCMLAIPQFHQGLELGMGMEVNKLRSPECGALMRHDMEYRNATQIYVTCSYKSGGECGVGEDSKSYLLVEEGLTHRPGGARNGRDRFGGLASHV